MLPAVGEKFILQTDASDVGLGATLLQHGDGQIFPVAYTSKHITGQRKKIFRDG